MASQIRAFGLTLLVLVGAGAQQPTRQTVSIKGIVVQLGTSDQVAKALVRLSKDNVSDALVVSTGIDGTFEFQNVPAGAYDLTAARNGYLVTSFGQRGPSVANGNSPLKLDRTSTTFGY